MLKNMLMTVLMIVGMTWAISDPKWVAVDSSRLSQTHIDIAHFGIFERKVTLWTRNSYLNEKFVNYNVRSKASIGTSLEDGNFTSNIKTSSQLEGNNQSYSYNNERIYQIIDCAHRTTSTIMVIRYLNDEVVMSQDYSHYNRDWNMVIPGTVGASIYNKACPDDIYSYSTTKSNKEEIKERNPTASIIMIIFMSFSLITLYIGINNY